MIYILDTVALVTALAVLHMTPELWILSFSLLAGNSHTRSCPQHGLRTSRACLTVRFLRYEIEIRLRAVYFAPTFHDMLCLVSCRWRHILHSSLVGWPEVFQQPWSFIAMGSVLLSFRDFVMWVDSWSWKKPNISAIFQIAHVCGQEENREWKQTRSQSRQPPWKKGLKTTNVEKGPV